MAKCICKPDQHSYMWFCPKLLPVKFESHNCIEGLVCCCVTISFHGNKEAQTRSSITMHSVLKLVWNSSVLNNSNQHQHLTSRTCL